MTDSNGNVSIFKVPEYNLPQLDAMLTKLGKRATKLGLTPPSYTVVQEEVKQVITKNGETQESSVIIIKHLVVHNPIVVVADHEFIATLDHGEEGNVVHAVRGKEVPKQYLNCDSWCVHCQTKRYRLETFVVRHIHSNEYKQIGRNCLADYLGRDAERYAALAEMWQEFSELCEAAESDSEGSWGGGSYRYDYLDSYLSYVAECISRFGWCSKAMASMEDGKVSTSDEAYIHLHPTEFSKIYFNCPSEESVETAKKSIEWCEAISDEETEKSNYLHNIRVIARRGVVGKKQYGMAASIVSGYQRHLSKLRLQEKNAQSNYVGNIGDKVIFSLFVDKVIEVTGFTSAYRSVSASLHIMSDKDGNVFVWKASNETLDTAKECVLKGTIKDHRDYKGTKQTVLTRCTVVEYKSYIANVAGNNFDIKAFSEKDAKEQLRTHLGFKRLPKGVVITEGKLA